MQGGTVSGRVRPVHAGFGHGDAIALIRQCRYALGLEKQQAGEYEAAAALFETSACMRTADARPALPLYGGARTRFPRASWKRRPSSFGSGRLQKTRRRNSRMWRRRWQRGAGGGRQPDGHRLAGAAPESEETRAAINRAVYAYAEAARFGRAEGKPPPSSSIRWAVMRMRWRGATRWNTSWR